MFHNFLDKSKNILARLRHMAKPWIRKCAPLGVFVKKKISIMKRYPIIYLSICFFCFFFLDFVARTPFAEYGVLSFYDNITLFFVIGWCCILSIIIYILPGKLKKGVFLFLILFLIVYICGQSVFYFLFKKFFSIADISLAREGADFVDSSYFQISPWQLIRCLFILVLAIVNCFLMTSKQKLRWQPVAVFIAGALMSFSTAIKSFPPMENPAMWAASSSPANIYDNFTNTTYNYLICGVYQYIYRDVSLAVKPAVNSSNVEIVDKLNTFYKNFEFAHEDNEMTGMYAGKNIVLLQLENIDTWMLNERATPTLFQMKESGIDFVNHYSAGFSTGRTFNTEFIVNTGMIPPIKGESPSYIFSRNVYPYAMGNIFKAAGYASESFHPNGSSTYNRTDAHKNFGYTRYHDWEELHMEDWMMDTGMNNGFDQMAMEEPFLDFIITISGHSPFSFESTACTTHYDDVVSTSLYDDEQYICAQAQARETDIFVSTLLSQFEEAGLLDNTVFVAYTDHFAYGTLSDDFYTILKGTSDPNLLQRTPFFVWSKDTQAMTVDKVTSSIDILPTVANLFDLPTQYQYYIGNDAFSDLGDYVYFEDGSLYNGEEYYNPVNSFETTKNMELQLQDALTRIQRSWDMLLSNYFKTI